MSHSFELCQILLACLCGFLIGFERQIHGASAGVRTYTLVCLGSCLFGIVSTHANGAAYYQSIADPTRIAAQIVSGVGFLGAGIIFKDNNKVHGLTTAANIWVCASIGLAIAFEMVLIPLATTGLVIFILSLNRLTLFKRLESYFSKNVEKDSHSE